MVAVTGRGCCLAASWATIAVALAACAGAPEAQLAGLASGSHAAGSLASAPQVAAPLPGNAQLLLTRSASVVHAATTVVVRVDGTKVAELVPGQTSTVPVSPRRLMLEVDARSFSGTARMEIEPNPGETIAVEVAPREGSLRTAVLFGAIGGDTGGGFNSDEGAFALRVLARTPAAEPATARRSHARPAAASGAISQPASGG